ncbi:hypothetical protein ACEPAH_1240 [Sanghuangporus vaninii]
MLDAYEHPNLSKQTMAELSSLVSSFPKLDTYVGALFIGSYFAIATTRSLYGLTTQQTFRYYRMYPNDSNSTKVMVGLVWLLDSTHSMLICHTCYYYLVSNYFNPLSLLDGVWSMQVCFVTLLPDQSNDLTQIVSTEDIHHLYGKVVSSINNCFSLMRSSGYLGYSRAHVSHAVYLSSSSVWNGTSIYVTGSSQCVSTKVGVNPLDEVLVYPDDFQVTKKSWVSFAIATASLICLGFTIATTVMTIRESSFVKFEHFTWLVCTTLGLNTISDVIITGSLGLYLQSRRTGFEKTNVIIDKLLLYVINTGILNIAYNIAVLICAAVMKDNLIFIGMFFLVSKLYSNSLLAVLNSRGITHEMCTQEINVVTPPDVYELYGSRRRTSNVDGIPVHPLPRPEGSRLKRQATIDIKITREIHTVSDNMHEESEDAVSIYRLMYPELY